MAPLPQDLITEILGRLPPKSLFRFRSLSKPFLSEIDDPEFVEFHLRRSLRSGSHQVLTFTSGGQAQLFDHHLDTPSCAEDLALPVIPVAGSPVRFIGSCHGLVALSYGHSDNNVHVVIWNPNTRKNWRVPPVSDIVYPRNIISDSAFGFGYDHLTEDYKLVQIAQFRQVSEVRVYCFKSNHWRRRLGDSPYLLPNSCRGRIGVLAHGALHFVALRRNVTAFSLRTEEFRSLVELPRYQSSMSGSLTEVTVLGGQLTAVFELWRGVMEAWVTKDYGGEEESWAKLFRVSLKSVPGYLIWIRSPPDRGFSSDRLHSSVFTPPFASSLYDSVFLLDYSRRENKALLLLHSKTGFGSSIAWINLKRGRVKKEKKIVERIHGRQNAAVLVASMASPGVVRNRKSNFELRH